MSTHSIKYPLPSKKAIGCSVFVLLAGIVIGLYSFDMALWYFVGIALVEVGIYLLVHYLKKNFHWLITPADFFPVFDKEGLAKFIEHGYDAELGWVRKPNTGKDEKGRHGKTKYRIDNKGRRCNHGHETLPEVISCYGDSFVFCRQVNDDETFEWYLSEMTKTNVLNFGVGNYGLDQAFLRLKREYPSNKTRVVILGVVPSTIVRILCVWKHYNEYGNIFGFKPRFLLANGQVRLIKNIIDEKDKFERFGEFLPEINRYDEFYETKFKKEMIRFPYLASVLSNPVRNLPLLVMVAWDRWFGGKRDDQSYPPPMSIIMKSNLRLRERLFRKDKSASDLLERLVLEFSRFGKENNFIPILLWMPQKDDLIRIKSKKNYYHAFIHRIKEKIITIDLTEELTKHNDINTLYSEDSSYGGHFSKQGNLLIAHIILQQLMNYTIIRKGENFDG